MTDADRITVLEAQIVTLSAAIGELQAQLAHLDVALDDRIVAAIKTAQRERRL